MTERQLQTRFKNLLSERLKAEKIPVFYYKIPDTKGMGGLRPFDSILLLQGTAFAIEFKVKERKLTKHQEYYMNMVVKTGNKTLVINEKNYKETVNVLVRGARYSYDLFQQFKKTNPDIGKISV